MELRAYYQKIRRIEAEIGDESAVVSSRETPDGGQAGVLTEVPRAIAARMIADGRAELASGDEAARFHLDVEEKRRVALGVRRRS